MTSSNDNLLYSEDGFRVYLKGQNLTCDTVLIVTEADDHIADIGLSLSHGLIRRVDKSLNEYYLIPDCLAQDHTLGFVWTDRGVRKSASVSLDFPFFDSVVRDYSDDKFDPNFHLNEDFNMIPVKHYENGQIPGTLMAVHGVSHGLDIL